MRKRKPPYILVSVLVVLLSLVFVANGGLQKVINDDDGHNHQAQQPQEVIPPTGESRKTDSVKSLAQATKNVASGTGAPAPQAPNGQHLPDAAPPSIEVTRAVPQKPVPNETMANSQWYRAAEEKKKGN